MTIKEPLKEQAWFPQAAVSVGEGEDSRHFLNKVGGQLKVKQGIVLGICSSFPTSLVSMGDRPSPAGFEGCECLKPQPPSGRLRGNVRSLLAVSFKTESGLFWGFLEALKYQTKN